MRNELIKMKFKSPAVAFEEAIAEKRLSHNETAPNFAGNYMYAGTKEGKDLFKNVDTRKYLD